MVGRCTAAGQWELVFLWALPAMGTERAEENCNAQKDVVVVRTIPHRFVREEPQKEKQKETEKEKER